jgi:hypothetical protein
MSLLEKKGERISKADTYIKKITINVYPHS